MGFIRKTSTLLVLAWPLIQAPVVWSKDYIVKLKPGISSASAQGSLRTNNFKVKAGLEKLNMMVVSQSSSSALKKFKEQMKNSIEYIEEDLMLYAFTAPNDPLFSSQSGMKRMGVEAAWSIETGDPDMIVAISDTGMQMDHPDLQDHLWTNDREVAGNGIDDDNNGYVDDVHGWNFLNNNNNPIDLNGHGTHVAGIIGAEANNGLGVSGVNWRVKLMPVQFMGQDGGGPTSAAVKTIVYAADNGAKVLNASWGGTGYTQALKDAIDYANRKGMLVIAAAGNESVDNEKELTYPASYESAGLIAVASSQQNGSLSSFSNYGQTTVDLAAPGSNILSTFINGRYDTLSGTSMATPMVVGVAALILAFKPELNVIQLRNAVLNAVIPHGNYAGRFSTEGDLSAELALTQLTQGFQVWPRRITLKPSVQFQFSAYNAQGSVQWSVNPPELGAIDGNGFFASAKHKDGGIATISARDASGQVVTTNQVRVLADKSVGGGGGCSQDANAADGAPGAPGARSNLWNIFAYAFILGGYMFVTRWRYNRSTQRVKHNQTK